MSVATSCSRIAADRAWGCLQVFRAEMAGSTPVAVKFVSRQSPRELKRFVHEIGILKSLRHTNIVQVTPCRLSPP